MRLTEQQTARAAGVLLGTAAGDALGAGYEFTHPAADAKIDMIGGGPFGFSPGEWTDDTSMAVAIAEVAAQGIDLRSENGLDEVAAQFLRWYDGNPKDIGNQTRAVLSARSTSGAWMQERARSITGRKGGNGSLMRTAPVALAYLGDEAGCIDAAVQVGALTHDDLRATQSCAMWTYAIRHAVLHGNFGGVRRYLEVARDDSAEFWGPLLDQAETGTPGDFPNNGWVVHALQTAWWAISVTDNSGPQHLQDALERAVRAGHDTDTTAAIAGGLLGARWGASAVPARWRRKLHGWPGLDASDLVRLAVRAAWGGRDDSMGWPSAAELDYSRYDIAQFAHHPHVSDVFLTGAGGLRLEGVASVVSLCRVGQKVPRPNHVRFWLADGGPDRNQNLDFVLDDAARTILELRQRYGNVLVHCVEGRSRTPAVAARMSIILGENPNDVLDALPWADPDPALWEVAVHPYRREASK